MKTHRTMLKNQSVFSYPWVARISCLRLSAPVCACLRLSACVGAQADALAHRQMRWRTGRFRSGHAGLARLKSSKPANSNVAVVDIAIKEMG